jgi:hypothetical protein
LWVQTWRELATENLAKKIKSSKLAKVKVPAGTWYQKALSFSSPPVHGIIVLRLVYWYRIRYRYLVHTCKTKYKSKDYHVCKKCICHVYTQVQVPVNSGSATTVFSPPPAPSSSQVPQLPLPRYSTSNIPAFMSRRHQHTTRVTPIRTTATRYMKRRTFWKGKLFLCFQRRCSPSNKHFSHWCDPTMQEE